MASSFPDDAVYARPGRRAAWTGAAWAYASILAAVAVTLCFLATAARAEIRVNSDGYAINGFDPVAYFTVGRPVKGKRDLTVTYNGAKYAFATAENRAMFLKKPAKYEPQYGGYCAYGVAYGSKSDIDPEVWEIVDGKLYLLINPGTMSIWQKKKRSYIRTADKAWKSIIHPSK
jgi:YHS domain-containing protein